MGKPLQNNDLAVSPSGGVSPAPPKGGLGLGRHRGDNQTEMASPEGDRRGDRRQETGDTTGGEVRGPTGYPELREGGFVLWPNQNKTAERQPDFIGSVKHGGVVYRLAGWMKERHGENYVSGELTVMPS
jgi:hypothetical protein